MRIFLAFLAVVNCALSEECSEEELQRCSKGLLEVMNGAKEMALNCEELREAKDCVLQFVDRCMSEEEKEGAKEGIDLLVRNVENDCPVKKRDANDLDSESVIAEECSEEGLQRCSKSLLEVMNGAKEMTLNCEELREAKDCVLQFVDRCMSEEEKEGAKEVIDLLISNVENDCPVKKRDANDLNDEKKKIIRCLDDNADMIERYMDQCAYETYLEITTFDMIKSLPNEVGDFVCQLALSTAQCATEKIGQLCGKEAEKPFFTSFMLRQVMNIPIAIRGSECAAAIKDAEQSDIGEIMRKRRSF